MITREERAAYNAMIEALRLIQWGNPSFPEDTCPRCGSIPKLGHRAWCQIGIALSMADSVSGEKPEEEL